MADDEGRPMTVGMCVKLLALATLASRMMRGAVWSGGDRDRFREAVLERVRIDVAAAEVQRVLRILEGEDSAEP